MGPEGYSPGKEEAAKWEAPKQEAPKPPQAQAETKVESAQETQEAQAKQQLQAEMKSCDRTIGDAVGAGLMQKVDMFALNSYTNAIESRLTQATGMQLEKAKYLIGTVREQTAKIDPYVSGPNRAQATPGMLDALKVNFEDRLGSVLKSELSRNIGEPFNKVAGESSSLKDVLRAYTVYKNGPTTGQLLNPSTEELFGGVE